MPMFVDIFEETLAVSRDTGTVANIDRMGSSKGSEAMDEAFLFQEDFACV